MSDSQELRWESADQGPVVLLEDVSKSLNDVAIVQDTSLQVNRGHIFGLVGPSGCGKTTLVRMMVGALTPTSGTVSVLGSNPVSFTSSERGRIGYMPQRFFLYPTLAVQENLSFVAGLYGMGWLNRRRRIREILTVFDLYDARSRPTRDVSGGMQRRLELACALVHSPEVIFIDEPTTGLDPILRARIWEYLRGLREQGTTIVLTTQYLEEAEYCDRLAVMSAGRIVTSGSPSELRRQALQGEVLEVDSERLRPEGVAALGELGCVRAIEWKGRDTILLTVSDLQAAMAKVVQLLEQRGVPQESVRPYVPTFNEVFLRLVSGHD